MVVAFVVVVVQRGCSCAWNDRASRQLFFALPCCRITCIVLGVQDEQDSLERQCRFSRDMTRVRRGGFNYFLSSSHCLTCSYYSSSLWQYCRELLRGATNAVRLLTASHCCHNCGCFNVPLARPFPRVGRNPHRGRPADSTASKCTTTSTNAGTASAIPMFHTLFALRVCF